MISAIELKRCVASVSIFGIILGKFCYKKKPYLVILFKIDKSLKIGFHYTILPFSMTVYLKVEGGGEFLLNVKKIA